MDQIIRGKAFVAGDNIDTDQIIPAEYLSYNPSDPAERKFFGKYAMSGVPIQQSGLPGGSVPFVKAGEMGSEFAVIVGGRNFGCGSSREHAPLAIAEAGCKVVIAQSYARIFYRNSVNGAYLVPLETAERLVGKVSTGDEVEVDLSAGTLKDMTTNQAFQLQPLGDVQAIIEAGGIFEYARRSNIQ